MPSGSWPSTASTGPARLHRRPGGPRAQERAWLEGPAAWGATEGAYAAMHRTKPQTAAFGLTDWPAGLAAWIVEKLRAWSDCGGEVERRFTKDKILTNVTLYWLTGTIGSSMHMSTANARDPARAACRPGRGAVGLLALCRRHRPPTPSVARAYGERRLRVHRARLRRALRAVRGARALPRRSSAPSSPAPTGRWRQAEGAAHSQRARLAGLAQVGSRLSQETGPNRPVACPIQQETARPGATLTTLRSLLLRRSVSSLEAHERTSPFSPELRTTPQPRSRR